MSIEVTAETRSDVQQRARMHAALGDPLRLTIVDRLFLGDAAPGELSRALGTPTNLLAHHLRILEESGLIRRVRSEGDRRRTYVRLDSFGSAAGKPGIPTAVGVAAGEIGPVGRVVFVCTRNSARSQLADAAWKQLSPTPSTSAGTHPARRVHPRTIAVGRRHGLGLSAKARTARVGDILRRNDLVVAVCDSAFEELARDGSGASPGRRSGLHWSVPDPVRLDTDNAFEAALQEILARVERLAHALNPLDRNNSRAERLGVRGSQPIGKGSRS